MGKHMRGAEDPGMSKKMHLEEEGVSLDKPVRGPEDPGMSKKMEAEEGDIQVQELREELEGEGRGVSGKMKAAQGGCNLGRILISTRMLPQVVPTTISSLGEPEGLTINSLRVSSRRTPQ